MKYLIKFNESKNIGIIYHFTHLMNLEFILSDDLYMTRYNDLPKYKYDYSISCTRNKSFAWGNVRICLDGDRISEKYIIKPVSYFKNNRSQAEERIFTNSDTFPIFDYIIRIDFLYFYENSEIQYIKDELDKRNIKYAFVKKF